MTSEEFGKILDDIYEKYDNKIQLTVFRARQSSNYSTVKYQRALSTRLNGILDSFQDEYLNALKKHIKVVAREQVGRFYSEYDEVGVNESRQNALKKANSYFNDKMFYVENHVRKMKQDIKTALKQDQLTITRHSLLNGVSRKVALEEVRGMLVANTIRTEFVNKIGSRYNSKSYFEMLGRTVISQFGNEVYQDTLIEHGIDLARISAHGATDRCRKWENRIISLTGATPGYPTLQDSKESGDIWHPRCKHFLIPVEVEDGV